MSCFRELSWFLFWLLSGLVVDSGEVVSDGGEGELVADAFEASGSELAQVALLFEHTEDGFDDGFSSGVGGSSCVVFQLLAHSQLGWGGCFGAALGSEVESLGEVGVGYVCVEALLFHPFEVGDGEEAAVGQHLAGG